MTEKKRRKRTEDEPETEHKPPAAYVVHHPDPPREDGDVFKRALDDIYGAGALRHVPPAIKVSL